MLNQYLHTCYHAYSLSACDFRNSLIVCPRCPSFCFSFDILSNTVSDERGELVRQLHRSENLAQQLARNNRCPWMHMCTYSHVQMNTARVCKFLGRIHTCNLLLAHLSSTCSLVDCCSISVSARMPLPTEIPSTIDASAFGERLDLLEDNKTRLEKENLDHMESIRRISAMNAQLRQELGHKNEALEQRNAAHGIAHENLRHELIKSQVCVAVCRNFLQLVVFNYEYPSLAFPAGRSRFCESM